jgi:hypothetical protein
MQIRYQAGIKPILIQPHSLHSPVFIEPALPSDFTFLQSFCCAVVNADCLMQLVRSEGGLGAGVGAGLICAPTTTPTVRPTAR